MSDTTVENSTDAIMLVHPFKDKFPDVDEFCKIEAGVVNTINSFCDRVERLSEKYSTQIDPDKFKGDAFELLVEYMIKVGGRGDNRIGISDYQLVDASEDYGVDGYGKGENGNPATVQIKSRPANWILTANVDHLTNFLSNSQNVHGVKIEDRKNMLIITTGKKVDEKTMENMLFNKVRVLNREALREMYDSDNEHNRDEWWKGFYESIKLSRIQKELVTPTVVLKLHQKEAIQAAENSIRGKIILPTGTGKTLIECELARLEILKQRAEGNFSPIIKVNAPRILLCFQLFEYYCEYFTVHKIDCRYSNYNSGNASDKKYAENMIKAGGIYRDIISTTSPTEIKDFYDKCKKENLPLFVFSTYHSAVKFDGSGITPDLTIHDEAHNLTSPTFSKVATLPSKRDLFFTATEKLTRDPDEDPNENEPETGLGMDNEEIFGKMIYHKSPREMIDAGEMVPPFIHVVKSKDGEKFNKEMVDRDYDALIKSVGDAFLAHQEKIKEVSCSPENIGAKILVVCRGQEDLKRMFKCRYFETFRTENPDVHIFGLSSTFGLYIDGDHKKTSVTNMKKQRLMGIIKACPPSGRFILFHVDMVGEGIDVPGITGVMPFRNCEKTKFYQNIGRASRPHGFDREKLQNGEITVPADAKDKIRKWYKPISWIIIPTYLENSEGFYKRFRWYIENLRNEYGLIPQEHIVTPNVRGEAENEEIDTVNEKNDNRRCLNSGLKNFEHEFEKLSIVEQVIHDMEAEKECRKIDDEFETLIADIV